MRRQQGGETLDLQFDHIIPVALGGATTFDKVQVWCGRCNLDKGVDR
jgi:5-methylcytosine-specific restriction endonuclease McrA